MKKILLTITVLTALTCGIAQSKNRLPKEKDMAAYMMVYFKDDSHGWYFTVNKDGYSFTDVNDAKPIIDILNQIPG